MGFVKPADGVVFADGRVEAKFNSLNESDWLKKSIRNAINNLKENAFCGERIKRELWPKEYVENYGIENLWWYPLPNAWRLIYSLVTPSKFEILAVIVEYMDHKNYERRFGY